VCRYERPQVPLAIQEDTAILLFEMVRELVFNIIKHSQAANAWVILVKNGEYVKITVSDDGVGFEPDKIEADNESFGLFSVRERLKHLNGSMEIETKPGGGTQISIWAPV
jgi:signal transduction histidine kinase